MPPRASAAPAFIRAARVESPGQVSRERGTPAAQGTQGRGLIVACRGRIKADGPIARELARDQGHERLSNHVIALQP